MDAKYTQTTLLLPAQPYLLEEVNLPPLLAAALAGQTVPVQVFDEEEAFTRRVDPTAESSAWIDPEGNYWNGYQPTRVQFIDPAKRAWRFPRGWLKSSIGGAPSDSLYPVNQGVSWTERVHIPTEWDLQDINIQLIEAVKASGKEAVVEVRVAPSEPVKVFWRDGSGTVWRIPHDWRRRRIKLPAFDVLVSQDIPREVAEEFAGSIMGVNYHPGSLCCLPDGYRFRDHEGNRWPVRMQDCLLLGYGDEEEHRA